MATPFRPQPLVPGGRNPSRLYESQIPERTVPRRVPQGRNYESELIPTPYRRNPRLYETGIGGVQDRYTQPQRLYESDIIESQRQPMNPNAGYNVLSGPKTGIPKRANDGSPDNPGNTGPASGAGELPPEEVVDPTAAAQQAFMARLLALRDETLGGYPVGTADIRSIYDIASKDLADPYNDYYNKAREGATSLGLDFANDDNVKLADVAARKLQENYDLNEASDLATVEKMKLLNTDSFTQMMVAAEAGLLGPQAIAAELAAAGGSGGGGRGGGRRGGGGGSSSSSSSGPWQEKATRDENFFNPGLATEIAGIQDPALRNYVDTMYLLGGTNPSTATTLTAKDLQKLQDEVFPVVTARGNNLFGKANQLMQKVAQGSAKAKNKQQQKVTNAAIAWWKQHNAGYVPRVGKETVSSTSTTKYKK